MGGMWSASDRHIDIAQQAYLPNYCITPPKLHPTRTFELKSTPTILSYGMGVESTAILVRWLKSPETRPCSLEDLVVITSQLGNEYDDTRRDVEAHILPLLREYGVRYVQISRRGHLEADGISILSDTTNPERLFIEGDYKLSDELREAVTETS